MSSHVLFPKYILSKRNEKLKNLLSSVNEIHYNTMKYPVNFIYDFCIGRFDLG